MKSMVFGNGPYIKTQPECDHFNTLREERELEESMIRIAQRYDFSPQPRTTRARQPCIQIIYRNYQRMRHPSPDGLETIGCLHRGYSHNGPEAQKEGICEWPCQGKGWRIHLEEEDGDDIEDSMVALDWGGRDWKWDSEEEEEEHSGADWSSEEELEVNEEEGESDITSGVGESDTGEEYSGADWSSEEELERNEEAGESDSTEEDNFDYYDEQHWETKEEEDEEAGREGNKKGTQPPLSSPWRSKENLEEGMEAEGADGLSEPVTSDCEEIVWSNGEEETGEEGVWSSEDDNDVETEEEGVWNSEDVETEEKDVAELPGKSTI